MTLKPITVTAVALLASAGIWNSSAAAATCWDGTDPSVILASGISAATITQQMTLSGGATCFAVGDAGGADNEFESLTSFSGTDIIAKQNTPGADEGPKPFGTIVTISGGSGAWDGATSGSFTFSSPSGYTDLTMLFKFGRGQTTPSWFAYSLSDSFTGGTWNITNLAGVNNGPNGLSHVVVYGNIAPIPIPAAGLLLLGALGGLGFAARRKRKAV